MLFISVKILVRGAKSILLWHIEKRVRKQIWFLHARVMLFEQLSAGSLFRIDISKVLLIFVVIRTIGLLLFLLISIWLCFILFFYSSFNFCLLIFCRLLSCACINLSNILVLNWRILCNYLYSDIFILHLIIIRGNLDAFLHFFFHLCNLSCLVICYWSDNRLRWVLIAHFLDLLCSLRSSLSLFQCRFDVPSLHLLDISEFPRRLSTGCFCLTILSKLILLLWLRKGL